MTDIEKDLERVKEILGSTDNMGTAEVCHMYLELFEHHRAGEVIDEIHTNVDNPMKHNVSGNMGRPSIIQEQYGKEYNES